MDMCGLLFRYYHHISFICRSTQALLFNAIQINNTVHPAVTADFQTTQMTCFGHVPYGPFLQCHLQTMMSIIFQITAIIREPFLFCRLLPVDIVIFIYRTLQCGSFQDQIKIPLVIFMCDIALQIHVLHRNADAGKGYSVRYSIHIFGLIVIQRLDKAACSISIRNQFTFFQMHLCICRFDQNHTAFTVVHISLLLRIIFLLIFRLFFQIHIGAEYGFMGCYHGDKKRDLFFGIPFIFPIRRQIQTV